MAKTFTETLKVTANVRFLSRLLLGRKNADLVVRFSLVDRQPMPIYLF